MVKVTITTFLYTLNLKHLKQLKDKKLMEELIRLLSVERQPTTAVLARTCMAVFFIHLVSNKGFAIFFRNRLRTNADHLANGRGP
jgi:hypothetical protein